MKKSIFYSLSVLLAFALVFTSCDKEDDYDFNSYVPVIVSLGGLGEATATGLQALTYTVPYRGGSTYAWSVSGIGATITKGALPSIANITFAQSSVNATAIISVVETTQGGKVSEPITKSVTLKPYVPVNLDLFTGNYIEADGDGQTAPVVISRDPADMLFGLIIKGVLGQAYWWGPPGGTLKIKLVGLDNSVTFEKQVVGPLSSTYGNVSLELLNGVKGSFDLTTKVISYRGKVTVAAGSFGDYPFTYTPAP